MRLLVALCAARRSGICLNTLKKSSTMMTTLTSTALPTPMVAPSTRRSSSSGGGDPHSGHHKTTTQHHHHHHQQQQQQQPRRRNTAEDVVGGRSTIGVFTPVTAALWIERLRREEGATLPPAPAPGPLPPSASAVAVSYPFTRDAQLRELYRNPWGFVRIGRILEDLDSMAGSIALEHFNGGGSGGRTSDGDGDGDDDGALPRRRAPVLVTASVDAIRLLRPLSVDRDAEARGKVVYTGKSSMDIRIELFSSTPSYSSDSDSASSASASEPDSSSSPALVAHFTFACRDEGNAPLPVPALAPSTAEERTMFEERAALAEARRKERKRSKGDSAASATVAAASFPSQSLSSFDAEVEATAAALLREAASASDLPALASGDAVPSRLTTTGNLFTCQPTQRNLAGRVFGGFLMRRAFELAFASAYTHAGALPRFVELERVDFLAPVGVGDLLRLRGSVLHVSSPRSSPASSTTVRVRVRADVVKPEQAASETSNTFVFAFRVPASGTRGGGGGEDGEEDGSSSSSRSVKRVLPETREEALAAAAYEVKERR